jgi:CDP-diacylglycerol--inositol 3-phosphatidyltransferase
MARRARSAVRASDAAPSSRRNVWLFVPNLIGYARIAVLSFALYLSPRPSSSASFFFLYFLTVALDAVDGPAARALAQESRFGAVLDMVTDRVSTAALLALIAADFSRAGQHALATTALGLLSLDVGAHWVQSAAAGAIGARSHKSLPAEPALLQWYYKRTNLFFVCLLSEFAGARAVPLI